MRECVIEKSGRKKCSVLRESMCAQERNREWETVRKEQGVLERDRESVRKEQRPLESVRKEQVVLETSKKSTGSGKECDRKE